MFFLKLSIFSPQSLTKLTSKIHEKQKPTCHENLRERVGAGSKWKVYSSHEGVCLIYKKMLLNIFIQICENCLGSNWGTEPTPRVSTKRKWLSHTLSQDHGRMDGWSSRISSCSLPIGARAQLPLTLTLFSCLPLSPVLFSLLSGFLYVSLTFSNAFLPI